MPCQVPPFVQPGDTVRIVATARKVSRTDLHAATEAFLSAGLRVDLGAHTLAEHHQFAGPDEARLADLNAALRDPVVKAILFARGGYGTTRMLDAVDWPALARQPKWLIGFSDLTAVLAAAAGQGVLSIHGPMAISYQMDVAPLSLTGLIRLLCGQGQLVHRAPLLLPHPQNRLGQATGPLIGGNLSLLAHLVGTPHEYDYRGAILFLEDLDEYLYHIDRMLRQLRRAGRLAQVAGVVVGSFTQLRDNPVPFGATLEDIVQDALAGLEVPVLFGFPAGHGRDNTPLLIGARTTMHVAAEAVQLIQHLD